MAISLKRIGALMLTALLCITACAVGFGRVEAAATLFSDDFRSGALSGWSAPSVGTVQNGQYVILYDGANFVRSGVGQRSYAVSAAVSVAGARAQNGFQTGGTAYLVARANESGTEGYEFGVGVSRNGAAYLRLFRRSASGQSQVLYQSSSTVSGVGAIHPDTVYRLKLIAAGDRLFCYVNDTLLTTVTDGTYADGRPGVRNVSAKGTFADFTVEAVPEQTLERLEIVDHSSTVSRAGKLYFTFKAVYNSVYGEQTLNQDTPGVVVSGLDGTVGEKTVTVQYAGRTLQFPVQVTEQYQAVGLYSEDFNGDLSAFEGGTLTNTDYGYTYRFETVNGMAVAEVPDMKGADLPIKITASLPESKSADFEGYTVVADAYIYSDAPTPTRRYGAASIVYAKDIASGDVYDLRVLSNGTVMVYCGSRMLYSTTAAELGISVAFGKKISLRAHIYTDYVELFCDGKKVYTDFAFSRSHASPYVGFSAIGGKVAFDRFAGASLEIKGDYAITSVAVVTTQNVAVNTVNSNGLDFSALVLRLNYLDGDVRYVPLTEERLSGYQPTASGTQTVTVSYAGHTTSFRYVYAPYLFSDDFQNGVSSKWNFPSSDGMYRSLVNGRLKFSYERKDAVNAAIHATVSGGDSWTDYAVSADVFLDSRANVNGKVRYIGVTARVADNSWYEYRLVCSGGVITGALYRFNRGVANILQNYSTASLQRCLDTTKSLSTAVEYTLQLEVSGKVLKTYLDGVLLSTYVDDSAEALSAGTAGLRNINNTAYVDNFIVRQCSGTVKRLRLSNMDGETLRVYQGFDIEPWNHALEVVYADGRTDTVPLQGEMLSAYDNTAVGKQKVQISYLGYTDFVTLTVEQRTDHIRAVEEAILSFDGTDGTDTAPFYALKEQYDSLSPYEVTQLGQKAVEKYRQWYEELERKAFPELEGSALLFADDFNGDTENDWSDSLEGNVGRWFMQNSLFYAAARPYNRYGTAWRTPDAYGELTSISADCTILSADSYTGLGINISEDGYYHTRISNRTRDDNDQVVYTLQLYKKTSQGHRLVDSTLPEVHGVKLGLNVRFNLRLTVKEQRVTVYVNDIAMLTYEDSGKRFGYGDCGMRVSEGDALFDNVRVYGTALERPSDTADIQPTEYTDDFEDETVGKSPSHWQEYRTAERDADNWRIYQKDSRVYGTEAFSGSTATWLHVFDKDPTVKVKFQVGKIGQNARIGFITRRSPDTAFVNIGYDFSVGKWYIASQESEASGAVYVWADESAPLSSGQWHTAEIVEKGKSVTLQVDGKAAVSSDAVLRTGYGRVGAFTENAALYLDEVRCTFSSGDVPADGLTSYVAVSEDYAGYMEIDSPDNGNTLIGLSERTKKLSTDAGLTWTDITGDASYRQLQTGMYPSLLKMHNGQYLQIRWGSDVVAEVSEDLKNWKTAGRIVPPEDQVDADGRYRIMLHVNSTTQVKRENGDYRIFLAVVFRRCDATGNTILGHYTQVYYSDDYGQSWQRSETTTKELLPGYDDEGTTTWAESKIIRCKDGTLRMYYSRNYLGCMQYTVSKDEGVTWEGLYQIPEMQCAMTSFSVFEDPTEEGTYYMLWLNGKTKFLGSVYPRNRISLVKSTDGQNWEFAMDCERMSDYISSLNGVELYQILDPSLYVTDKYVYITFGRSEREFSKDDAFSHQQQRCYYIRAEKSKLTTRPWDASTLASMRYPKSVAFENAPQSRFGQGDLFNTVGTIRLTDFAGNETVEDISENCTVYTEPNMFRMGSQTVKLYYKNGTELSYDITIVRNYTIQWNISDGGTVEPVASRIMEGESKKFTLLPERGYKVRGVYVNGTKASVHRRSFVLENVTDHVTVDVTFARKTVLDYLVWILPGAALCGGGIWLLLWWLKRRRMAKSSADTNEAAKNLRDLESPKI